MELHLEKGDLISTHAPLAGRDAVSDTVSAKNDFYSRAPRGARLVAAAKKAGFEISTHAPLAGRDFGVDYFGKILIISTHAPLAGRDKSRNNIVPC